MTTTFIERMQAETRAERERLYEEMKQRCPDIMAQLADLDRIERSLLGVTEHAELTPPAPPPEPAEVTDALVEEDETEDEIPLTDDDAVDATGRRIGRRGGARLKGKAQHATIITDEGLRDYVVANHRDGQPFRSGPVAAHFDVETGTAAAALRRHANGSGLGFLKMFGKGAGTRYAYVTHVPDPHARTTSGGRGDGPLVPASARLPRRGVTVAHTGKPVGRSGKPGLDKKRAGQGKRVKRGRVGS